MEIIRLAAVQQKIQKGKIQNTSKILLQVAYLDDQMSKLNILDWNKINSEETMREEIKASLPKMAHFLDLAKVKYESKIENTQNEVAKGYAEKSLENVPLWSGFILGADAEEYDWKKDAGFLYIVGVSVLGQGLRPDADGLKQLYQEMKGDEPKSGKKAIIKRYKAIVDAIDEGVDAEDDTNILGKTGWVEIPGGREDSTPNVHAEDVRNTDPKYESFNERLYLLKRVVDGSGWCLTGSGTREGYLASGKMLFYLEDGRPKLCIRMIGDDRVAEIQGLNNQDINGYLFGDKIVEIHEKYPELNLETSHHGLAPQKAALGKERVDTYNAMSVEELTGRMNGRGATNAFFFLLDSTIAKCWENPEFVERAKHCLTMMGIVPNVELAHHLNRFPKLKDDPELFRRALSITKTDFRPVFETGIHTMATSDIVALNKTMKGNLAKHPDIQALGQQTMARLLEGELNEEAINKMMDLDAYMKGNLGDNQQVKEMANALAVQALVDGDIEKFRRLQEAFEITQTEGDLKEQAYEPARREAVRLIINDPKAFEKLDEFFDKKLSDDMDAILQDALPQAKEAAITYLNANDFVDFKALNERFKDLLVANEEVYVTGREIAKSALIREDDDRFDLVDDAFGGRMTADKEHVIDDVYLALKPKVQRVLVMQELEALYAYNEKLNNRVLDDPNLLNDTFELAVERCLYLLDWGVVKTEEGDWLKSFSTLNVTFGGRLARDPRVTASAKDLATKSLIYCDPSSPEGCNNPYWKRILKRLYKAYGASLITRKDLARLRQEYAIAAYRIGMTSLEKGDAQQLQLLVNSYPDLLRNRNLVDSAVKKSERLLSGYYMYDPAVARMKFNEWDQVFNGELSANPRIQQALNRVAGSTWYSFFRHSKKES